MDDDKVIAQFFETVDAERIARWLRWMYDQGYEMVNRDLLDKRDPNANGRIHIYCLDDGEVLEMVDEWRIEQGEPSLYADLPDEPDPNIALTA